jgi:hypothetical protein
LIDFPIREAKDFVVSFSQRFVSRCIPLTMIVEPMLMTVDLNNDSRPPTFKIDDGRRKRRLSAEVMTKGAKLTEANPQLHLLACH